MQDLLRLLAISLAALALTAGPAYAQPPADDDVDDEELDDEDYDDEDDEDLDEPQLRAPQLEMPDVSTDEDEDDDLDEDEDEDRDEDAQLADPGDDEDEDLDPDSDMDLLSAAEPPPSSDPTLTRWTTPRSVLSLSGYFRTRGELWDNFFLGRGFSSRGLGAEPVYNADDLPFSRFVPGDRIAVSGRGCERPDDDAGPCNSSDRLRFANMRLRLRPTIALSDDVKVHMMIDAFDNLVLGSTPDSVAYVSPTEPFRMGDMTGETRLTRSTDPAVPIDSFATTQNPAMANRNSGRDSIYVRRAWAEVSNRGIGSLHFGRMGWHWGLGILANGGDGIDSDFSTDVDRIQLVTKLAGFHFFGSYDFAAQGIIQQLPTDFRDIPFDLTAKDDIRQYVVGAARREEDDVAQSRLQRGSWVLEGGVQFVYRSQSFTTAGVVPAYPGAATDFLIVERGANQYIPDLWGRFRWGGLRLEVEMAAIFGGIDNINDTDYDGDSFDIRQFGFAFEGEYRLLDDKLAIRLYTGYATGDADADGLSARENITNQVTDDRVISAFQFHPNYRVDLILWRNIMQRFSSAWYLKPGLGYDIIRNPFGQVFGVRADAIYSRAAQEVQTYGVDPNLGLELNFSLYYQSEDGPDLMDGFYASFQYGVLFPFAGLEFPDGDDRADVLDVSNAQALRLILGVQY